MIENSEQKSFLDQPLAAAMKIDWDRTLLIALLVLSIVTRLWDLSYRAWNHDEAIHTDWAWNLYTGRGYQHNPIYHGPLLYHVTALSFFLFGDNDTTARLPNAVFGIILVTLPFFFRKWLGRKGWVATALMLLISPSILYYSRFNRHDIYVELFVVLMALTIWKYFDERKEIWLVATAALLALAYTAMETTFIFVAIFAIFLTAHFTFEYLRPRVNWHNSLLGLFASVLGIPFFGFFVAYQAIRSIAGKKVEATWRAIPSFDLAMILGTFSLPLLTPALFRFIFNPIWNRLFNADFFPLSAFTDVSVLTQMAQTQFDVVLRVIILTGAMILLAALIGIWWNARVWSISAVLFWPIFVVFFTTIFTNGGGFFTGLLGSLGYWLSQQEVARGGQPPYYYLLVTLPLYEFLPYCVGIIAILWYWLRYRPGQLLVMLGWMLWCIVYYVAVRPLLLGVSINPTDTSAATIPATSGLAGIADPLVIVFIFVLILLTFFTTYDPDKPESQFPTFLFTWSIGTMLIFSWAGEKMPWLTMHLAIPLAFISGWAIDKLLDVDWRDLFARGAVWLALLIPLALIAIAAILFGARPFQGVTLDQLSASNGFIVALVMLLLFVVPALYFIGRRFSAREIIRIAAITFVLILGALTIRSAAMAVYINPDNAVETMIYAQGSHDDVTAIREIDDLSQRLCGQVAPGKQQTIQCDNGKIKVAYDDDSSWPFVWYLRNYANAQFYGKTPGAPFDAEVVLVGSANEDAVKPFLGNKYIKRIYKLIWWPLEGYKDIRWQRDPLGYGLPKDFDITPYVGKWIAIDGGQVIGVGGTQDKARNDAQTKQPTAQPIVIQVPAVITDYILNPGVRTDLFNGWFYHQYNDSASQWPYVHNFSFYVRKDIAAQLWNYAGQIPAAPTVQDEYDTKFVKLAATRSIGATGSGNGQLQNPKNVAIDSQGNLYVADSDNGRIEKFDKNGTFVTAWGTKSPPNLIGPQNTFSEIWGIAVDKSGNVYVADTWNHRIQKFDSNGKFLTMWGVNGDTRGVALGNPLQFYGPRAIAIDSQGNVLVTDTGNKRVLKFDPNGNPLAQYGGVGGDPGQFLEQVGIAVDSQGNIFVADTWNQRIQKFDSNFGFVAQWTVEAWDSQSVVNKPYIAVDPDGNVFITDPEISRIIKFSNDGKLLAVFGARGGDLSSFNLPIGLAFDAQGNLYVADSGNNRILVFTKP